MRSPLLCVVLLAPLAACGGNTPAPRTGAEVTQAAPPASPPNNTPTRASPNVSVGADIAALCNLQLTKVTDAPKFDFDSAELLPEDVRVLDQVAECFTRGPLKGRRLDLVGRADPRGTEGYNFALGAKRAHQVGDYLERKGITPQRVKETSRGDLDAAGHDEAGWRVDRRVDLLLGS